MIPVPINPENITKHELIGLKTTISKSNDPHILNLNGMIINERQKTLVIRTKKKAITTTKKDNTYKVTLQNGTRVEIDGKLLHGRPEDRIKKKNPNKWKMMQ